MIILADWATVDGSTRVVRDRNMIRRASEINREGRTVEILAFGQVVNEVQYHARPLHKWQAQNGVDGDVRTRGDQEQGFLPIRRLVGEVKLKSHL